MDGLILFIIITVINIASGTVKTIATVNSKPIPAGIINAINYTINSVVVKMVASQSMLVVILVMFFANLICVPVTKAIMDAVKKEKLFVFEATLKTNSDRAYLIKQEFKSKSIGTIYDEIVVDKIYLFKIFCETKEQSKYVKKFLKDMNAKYYIVEGI